jgi:ribosomal protein S18 acetylase RimI-like enzyme
MDRSALSFITATSDDVGRVLALVRARAEWIRAKGSRQWQVFLTDDAETLVSRLVATGRTHLVTLDGRDVGTLRLDWSDERFWGARGLDGSAGYVHTLATHRDFAGQRLVAHMLQWACDRIVEAGRELLRIDCDATNATLVAYYLSFGLEPREVVPMESIMPGYRSQLLERSAHERVG